MKPSSTTAQLAIILKASMFIHLNCGNLRNFFIFMKILNTTFICTFIIYNIVYDDSRYATFGTTHDVLIECMVISQDPTVLGNKEKLLQLLTYILEPLPIKESGSHYSHVIKNYIKNVNRCGKMVIFFLLLCFFWALMPLFLSFFPTVKSTSDKPYSLIMNWVLEAETPNHLAITLFIASMSTSLFGASSLFCLYLIMTYSVLKIKLMVNLLVIDLANMDERSQNMCETELDSMMSTGRLPFCRMCSKRNKDVLEGRRKLVRFPGEGAVNRDCCKEVFRKELLSTILRGLFNEAVERHVEILKFVKLVDHAFRAPAVLFSHIAVLLPALILPELNSIQNHLSPTETFYGTIEIMVGMAIVAIINYLGQVVLDEIERLRIMTYEFNWIDKPPSFQRSLRIMQTVATRRQRLSAGGMYTISLKSYSRIVQATYSYLNLMQTMKQKAI